ncbi:MAG TPA: PAS domain S-box protein, partial [Pyrinomonadaceae bacterium]|nr:PAS domain S-box protein [Pyrinomonadaceae bacterium]
KIFGHTAKEIIGQNISVLYPPERFAEDEENELQKKLERGERIHNFETVRLRKDGTRVSVSLSDSAIKNKSSEIIAISKIAHDLTRRKRTEASLRASEERFGKLVEASIIGIIITNLSGIVIEANSVFLKMVGYSRAELLAGKVRWDQMTQPEFNLESERAELTEYGATKPHEKEYIRKDGTRIPVLVGGTRLDKLENTILAFVLDITDQKRAAEELRDLYVENERQARSFDTILTTISELTYTFDREGRFRYANKPVLDIFGKQLEDLIGKTFLDLDYPKNLTATIRENIQRVFDTGKSVSDETQFQNAAGETESYEYIFNPVLSADGKVEYLVGSARNTTKRKNADRLLREAEANYRNLVESSPAIVYLAKPTLPFTPVYISPKISDLGFTKEEWISEPDKWIGLIHEDDRKRVVGAIDEAIDLGLPLEIEYKIIAPDKTIHWLHEKGYLILDEAGDRTGWQGVILDVTAAKELEQQLGQAQKLESIGLLAGGIAHDFNNMLTAINGYSDLTLRKMNEDDPLRRNIEEIQKAGRHSAELTYQLLAFSRKLILIPVLVDINFVITDTIKMLQRVIGEDIQLTASLDPMVGRTMVDPGQFAQIIMNLAVNARDSMPGGGELVIKTGNFSLKAELAGEHAGFPLGDYVLLSVTDTGTGMSAETIEHIFDPFFTTKELGRGTGLGLATLYGIVQQSGGQIEVESELGTGTTFKIYLPRVIESKKVVIQKKIASEIKKGTETILLVEDEPLVQNLVVEFLEQCGYTVIQANNGKAALEICDKHEREFDMLITDVVMPQMGGRALSEHIRMRFPSLPVLFTSGYTDENLVRGALATPNTSFIQKPFSFEPLVNQVREMLDAVTSLS